jgi:RNA polymerase sigma-70 factor (ECF subfamily)
MRASQLAMTEPNDEDRLRALLDEYSDIIRRAIRRYAGGGSGVDLDDIEQEVRLRVWRAVQEQRELARPASYLYRVAVTASLDAWRRLRARREEPLASPEGERTEPRSVSASPERVAESRQRLRSSRCRCSLRSSPGRPLPGCGQWRRG